MQLRQVDRWVSGSAPNIWVQNVELFLFRLKKTETYPRMYPEE